MEARFKFGSVNVIDGRLLLRGRENSVDGKDKERVENTGESFWNVCL